MVRGIRRWLTHRGTDPKVQLEQAIAAALDQHRKVREQAAGLIDTQEQTELRLARALEELEKVDGNARRAARLADEAATAGDAVKEAEHTTAADSFATRLTALEREVEGLKELARQSSQAAGEARTAVETSAAELQARLAERSALMSPDDQAEMRIRLDAAIAALQANAGQDVPSLDEPSAP